MLTNKQVGFIGGGTIAEALIRGIVDAGLVAPSQIAVSDVVTERLDYLRSTFKVSTTQNSQELTKQSDILFLTVKPQVLCGVLETIAPVVARTSVVVSVAAGITITTLQEKLPEVPIIRVMPNTPVAVGEGMSAMALGKYVTSEASEPVAQIFGAVGKVVTVSEDTMDAVTGLSGSGPAYAFVLIDALADAGVRVGFSRQTAILLAAQTLLGAAKMVLETGQHPAILRDMVTSPGGTSIAGVHVLEQHGVRAALIDAVMAATDRSREMGRS